MEIKTKRVIIETKNKKDIENVIFLFFDYYMYDLPGTFQSKAEKMIIKTKHFEIPDHYQKQFHKVVDVEPNYCYEEIKEIIKNFLNGKNLEKTLIVPCDEEFHIMASKLRKDLGVPGFNEEKMLNLTDKVKMKELMVKHNVPTYLYSLINVLQLNENFSCYIEELEKKINYPMFQKPTCLFGSKMIKLIKDKEDLIESLKFIQNNKLEFEIGEYVSDYVINCDLIVVEEEVIFFRTRIAIDGGSANIIYGKNVARCVIPPSHEIYKKALKQTQLVVKAYQGNLDSKCLNLEFIVKNQQDLLFLELNYRRAGLKGVYDFDYSFQDGFNLELVDLDLAFGGNQISIPEDDFESDYEFYVGSVTYPANQSGVVKALKPVPVLSSEYQIELFVKEGDEVVKSPDFRKIFGRIVLRNRSFSDLYREIQRLNFWCPLSFK